MRTGFLVVLAAVAVLPACSNDAPPSNPQVPSFAASTTPSVAGDRAIPNSCGEVARLDEVTDILQVAVTGQTLPIIGVPEPKIGRTARIDCYYGIPEGKDRTGAVVTIFLAGYTDEAAARKRVDSTIADEKSAGAKATGVPVGADRGVLLDASTRTLVAARGKNTVVVTVVLDLLADDQAGMLIGRLADRALTPR